MMPIPSRQGAAAHCLVALAALLSLSAGCSGPDRSEGAKASLGRYEPIDDSTAPFWDRQTTETAKLLQEITDEFNQSRDGLPLRLVQGGGYSDIYRKVTASIQAGKLPAMAVAYESMTSEYARAGAIVPMETFFDDPELGLSEEELADFFPAVLETNTFEEYGGKMYSFPFTKSVLVLYFNKRVMAEAGLSDPPKTWDEFIEQCRAVKRETGKFAIAIDLDASTVNGMIFSMGGEVLAKKGLTQAKRGTSEDVSVPFLATTLFDSPASIRVFELFETLAKEKLAYQIPLGSYDDEVDFGDGRIAFSLRSSSGKPHFAMMIGGYEGWGMAAIPQADPSDPHTVLYGANISIFDTTPEQKATAWAFAKFFNSPAISVRWALGTGYLPIRKSAAEDPVIQAFWAEWPYNRAPFDCLSFAKPEPNVSGWQEVRSLIEKAQAAVLSGMKTGRDAAIDLKRGADAVLAAR